ncbi:MAG: DUF4920 domain-containing protein [Woeseiaceae bacterium]
MVKQITRHLSLKCSIIAMALVTAGVNLAAAESKVVRLSEPVEKTADTESFGAPLDESVQSVSLEVLANDGGAYVGQSVRVVARVAQVCQKKGCFFIAQEGSSVVRVSFKDYGFFVPSDISGKRVTFIGEVVAREVSADEAAHYTEDLGTEAVSVEPGEVYEIVATSVRVPRT